MKVIRINITSPEDEDFLRVVDIPEEFTLDLLHLTILSAVDFDNSQLASFYLSDRDWGKGQEITLLEMGEDEGALVMDQYKLSDILKEPGDRLVYVYDFVQMWTFHVEMNDRLPKDELEYPVLIKEIGKAPEQYGDNARFGGKLSDSDKDIMDQMKLDDPEDVFDEDEFNDERWEDLDEEDFY